MRRFLLWLFAPLARLGFAHLARIGAVQCMISPAELDMFIQRTYEQADLMLTQAGARPPSRIYQPKRFALLFTGIGPGQTQSLPINVSANGDFFLTKMLYAANIGNAAQTSSTLVQPELRVQITDTGSDELFANQAVDINSIASLAAAANKDCDEPYPRCISGRSALNIVITNQEPTNTYNVEFILVGVLVKSTGSAM